MVTTPRATTAAVASIVYLLSLQSFGLELKRLSGLRKNSSATTMPSSHITGSTTTVTNAIETTTEKPQRSAPLIASGALLPPNSHHGHKNLLPKTAGASYFFTNVGPNSFEYRGMFEPGRNPLEARRELGSVFADFPNFPPLPNFDEVFGRKRQRNDNSLSGPSESGTTPRPTHFNLYRPGASQPKIPKPVPPPGEFPPPYFNFLRDNGFTVPPPKFDVFRGSSGDEPKSPPQPPQAQTYPRAANSYPKIFRFNGERINIDDFDRKKKKGKVGGLRKGDYLDPERISRDKFLILHGGFYDEDTSRNLIKERTPRHQQYDRNPQYYF